MYTVLSFQYFLCYEFEKKKKKNDLLELRYIHVYSLLAKSSSYFKLVGFNIVFNVVISLVLYTIIYFKHGTLYFYMGISSVYKMDLHEIPLNFFFLFKN